MGAAVAYAFRERHIYLRSGREVRAVALGPGKQVAALLAIVVGAFWLAYASLSLLLNDHRAASSGPEEYRAGLEYEDRLIAMRAAMDRLNEKLLLDQAGYLDKVDEVRADYHKLVERHRALFEMLRRGARAEDMLREDGDAPARDGSLEDLFPTPMRASKSSLNEQSVRQRYAAAFRSSDEVLQPLEELRKNFGAFEREQAALLEDATRESQKRVRAIGKVLAGLGISKKQLPALASVDELSVGGPLLPPSLIDLESGSLLESVELAAQSFSHEDRLLGGARSLPLSMPIAGPSRITSRFGLRRDPFRRIPALHSGIDIRGGVGSSVVATAPGRVVSAGWDGAYGRSVEIVHDNALSTVYAHLRSIKVRRGQTVERGQVVGLIGSTGRSTGPHLHYETRIGGRSVDPARFWKARYALQALSQQR